MYEILMTMTMNNNEKKGLDSERPFDHEPDLDNHKLVHKCEGYSLKPLEFVLIISFTCYNTPIYPRIPHQYPQS